MLNGLEKVEQADSGGQLGPICAGLRAACERLVLGESKDPQRDIETIAAGTALMQDLADGKPKGKKAQAKKIADFLAGLEGAAPLAEAASGAKGEVEAAAEPPAAEEAVSSADVELYHGFMAEATEGLEQIEVGVLSLEEAPDNKELLNSIFRTFHTLKGTAGFLSLGTVHTISHQTETLLGKVRDGNLRINHDIIDFILYTIDLVKGLVGGIGERLEAGLAPDGEVDLGAFAARLNDLERCPSPPLGEVLVQSGAVTSDDIAHALKLQSSERKGVKLGEILVQEGKATARDIATALREQRQTTGDAGGFTTTVRVATTKLDNLVDMVGELVITQSQVRQNRMLGQAVDQKLHRDLSQLSRIITELQRTAMSLRMVPIRQTFQKMIRLVRDLAQKSGKEVELLMHGEETEIDRNMVDEIYEPLVHLVRNAIDHGLETPEAREAAGKARSGSVTLRAFHRGGSIIIEISDDGRGLDRERILAKAVERGLIERGDHLDDHQVWNLVFEAGFSTAEKVSEVSGRGVGMDVVRRAIEKLHGKTDIQSEHGKGSSIAMRLPLTMAIIDGMVVRVGPERYIIPTAAVRESLRLEKGSYFTVAGRGEMANIRGSLSPLVRLHRVFGVEPLRPDPYEGLVVVVENEGRQKCLLVDELLDKQELVIKSLGEALKGLKGIAGGAILGDGRIGLILDVADLFELTEGPDRLRGAAPQAMDFFELDSNQLPAGS
jgi:two-component system chemotaxis sensor kinase CheA